MKLRAPRGNGEVLAEPGFDALPGLVEANRRKLDRSDVIIDGLPLRELRVLARCEIVAEAQEYLQAYRQIPGSSVPELSMPLVLAGHQPELSHPGVWIKNFALNGLARRIGGIPLNLVANTDTIKSTSFRVPMWDRDPLHVHVQSVLFDEQRRETPYEWRLIHDPNLFFSFPDRVEPLIRNWPYVPVLREAWQAILRPAFAIGESFAALRRQFEKMWGCHNLELPVSWLSETTSFRHFATDIATNLGRFREIYNRAVQSYRDRNGIRSVSHPVPDLAEGEVPFWGLPAGPEGKRSRFPTLDQQFRPRALTLTLFARVCLGDFFIHGIGGGTYDEVTDDIIRNYYGLEPPAYQVLSATLHLPLPALPGNSEDLKRAERQVRDLWWNPQRHLRPERITDEVRSLLNWKAGLSANEPPYEDHAARRWRFQNLQNVTEQLRRFVDEDHRAAAAQLEVVKEQTRANAILQRRDYAWVLYPEEMLREMAACGLTLNTSISRETVTSRAP